MLRDRGPMDIGAMGQDIERWLSQPGAENSHRDAYYLSFESDRLKALYGERHRATGVGPSINKHDRQREKKKRKHDRQRQNRAEREKGAEAGAGAGGGGGAGAYGPQSEGVGKGNGEPSAVIDLSKDAESDPDEVKQPPAKERAVKEPEIITVS
jgi:hypothetical protein